MRLLVFLAAAIAASRLLTLPVTAQSKAPLYNTAKQKLLDGKQVFSYTQSKFDVAGNCEAAKHYDYTWYEMQHSTLEFKDIEAMIGVPARRCDSHDPSARCTGVAHPACHRHRSAGRGHPDRG